jgi:DNA-binding NtrC family response regulator
MAKILVSDHLSERRDIICTFLRADEHVLVPFSRDTEALKALREIRPDLIILEGTVGGARLMSEARELNPAVGLILMMPAMPTVDQVTELLNQGVSDIIVSPLDINDVQTKVERALARTAAVDAVEIRFHDLVGASPKMQQVFRRLLKCSVTNSPVLLIGEQGTGKGLVASQIHRLSPRKDHPFRITHCAGLSCKEAESELFGHEQGAFSWAVEKQPGPIESSEGGTLFLDEVADLPPHIQGRMLRFLEDKTVQRLGSSKTFSADVRVLAASAHPLQQRVAEGAFRGDLYYLLSACVIELPPLRARADDIPSMVEMFLARYAVEIAGEAMEVLMNYAWPGNVDELKNAVEQAVTLCDGNRVELRNLPSRVLRAVAEGNRKHKYVPRPAITEQMTKRS